MGLESTLLSNTTLICIDPSPCAPRNFSSSRPSTEDTIHTGGINGVSPSLVKSFDKYTLLVVLMIISLTMFDLEYLAITVERLLSKSVNL